MIQRRARMQKPLLSFEIFPPKRTGDLASLYKTVEALADLSPDFISVTYGAAGSERGESTLALADWIQRNTGIEALSHLTCIGASKKEMEATLDALEEKNLRQVLALRGDLPESGEGARDFHHASDLVEYIKRREGFSVGAACYPEGHVEAKSRTLDLIHLKKKVDSGSDFLISQLFFDNENFYDFQREARSLDIDIPIFAGVMPVLARRQIERMVSLSGASLPPKFKKVLMKYEHNQEALYDAGIAYALEQMVDLLSSGTDGIHLYVMNKPHVARRLVEGIQGILGALRSEAVHAKRA